MHENFLHGVFFKCGYKPLVMERSANITNCRCTVSELLYITYITSCSVCVFVCACFSLKGAGFPLHLLPQCVPSGGVAGQTHSEWHGIPAGTPVGAALGDFQCSVYSCMSAQTDAGEIGSAVTSPLTSSHLQQKYTITLLQSTHSSINGNITDAINMHGNFCCLLSMMSLCSKLRPDIHSWLYTTSQTMSRE